MNKSNYEIEQLCILTAALQGSWSGIEHEGPGGRHKSVQKVAGLEVKFGFQASVHSHVPLDQCSI